MKHSPCSILIALALGYALTAFTRAEDKPRLAPDDRLLMVREKGKFGFVDRTGKVVVQLKYDDVESYGSTTSRSLDEISRRSYSEGLRPVKLGEKWGYIDGQEKFVIAPAFDMAGPFCDGRAEVRQDEKWGLIDRTGKVIVEPHFSYIAPFQGGLAPVAVGGEREEGGLPGSKWGLLDARGKLILETKYAMVYLLSDGIVLANIGGAWKGPYGGIIHGGKWRVADRHGKFFIEPSITLPTKPDLYGPPSMDPEAELWEGAARLLFADGRTPIAVEGKWGYMDERARIAIKPQFDWAGPFAVPPHPESYWSPELHAYGGATKTKPSEPTRLARAQLKGKFGFIDRMGQWAVKPIYDRIGHFAGGLAWVKQGDRFAYVDEKGVEAFTVEKGEEGRLLWNGLAAVRVGELWGYVDNTGRWLHKPQFDEVDTLTSSLQIVEKNKKRGLINHMGKLVCPVQYDWISEAGNSGLAVIHVGLDVVESQRGLMNTAGRFILEPSKGRNFSNVLDPDISDQKIFPRRTDLLWGFVDRDGKLVIEPQFESIEMRGEGMIAVRAKGQTGLVDVRSGKLVCPPKYDLIGKFSDGLAEVRPESGGKVGFLDRTGKVVIAPTWQSVGSFINGFAPVSPSSSTSLPQHLWIDRSGKYLWEPPKK